MATDADNKDRKTNDLIDIEVAQGKTAVHDFTPSERGFLDEVSAASREVDHEPAVEQSHRKDRSPRARRRTTH